MNNKMENNYNEDPVFYCKDCLSLKIHSIPQLDNSDYCETCGSNNVGQCSIEEWEQLFESKYGYKYLEENGRDKYARGKDWDYNYGKGYFEK